MQVDFYHLTQLPLERALPRIAERVVAGGGRLLVVAEHEEARQALDRCLWAYAPKASYHTHRRVARATLASLC